MSLRPTAIARAALAPALALLVLLGFTAVAPVARADSAPADPSLPTTPATVSADGLPTVQINGVVWSQVVVGNTVYAAGSFTRARPAGSPPGTNETVRNNFLAYDIRTGALITSFAPDLDAQAMVVAASPDGSRVYVGGDMNVANGQPRYGIAAYSTATGQLIDTFKPIVGSQVRAIAVTNSTVYIGGYNFGVAGGAARGFLAAFNASDGSVTSWNPVVDNTVNALAVVNGGAAVVIGGHMTKLNGAAVNGIGEVSATTGQNLPFAASGFTLDGGNDSGFTALAVDNDTLYATGYSYFSVGNLEGMLAINPQGGAVKWVDDCRGDSYSIYATGKVEYIAGHAHVCANIGGFPQVGGTDQSLWTHYRTMAFSKAATGTVGAQTGNFAGSPAPSLLNWFPTVDEGTYTGQNQGPWSVTGNSQYVVYGGEFPTVNGTMQQGLVRFPATGIAPNKVGPVASTGLTPTLASTSAGTVRVSWQATSDQDNAVLTYDVFRSDQPNAPVYTTSASSTFWATPALGFLDRTAPAGKKVSYSVTARDSFGNSVSGGAASITVTSTPGPAIDDYAGAVISDGPSDYWRLGESSGSALLDTVGTYDLVRGSGTTLGRAGALNGRADTAVAFNGSSSGTASTQTPVTGPDVFSLEAWFSTTSRSGGQLVGFGDAQTGQSANHDRFLAVSGSGQVSFNVWPETSATVTSAGGYNDGSWHHVVATLSPSGMALYVDGKLVGGKANATSGQDLTAYWRVGGDTTWDGSGPYLQGAIDEVAVYPRALTAAQVARHYSVGSTLPGAVPPPANTAPTASFTSSASNLALSVDGSASADPDGTIASYGWDFGDGSTGTGRTASHTYAAAGTYAVKLTVTDNAGATGSVTRSVTVTAPAGGSVLASDAFGRSVTGGWGSADTGGAWTVSAGAPSDATVTAGSGRLTAAPGVTTGASLGISARDVTLQADVTLQKAPAGGGNFVSLGMRQVGSSLYETMLYYATDGSVTIIPAVIVNGAETDLPSYTLPGTFAAGTVLTVRTQAVGAGPTTLSSKAWTAGTAEPAGWQLTATDNTAALQAAGGLYVELYTSGKATGAQTLQVDNLSATVPGAAVNVAPTASFTSSASNLALSVDGSASTDPDGSVASWAWDFGDGKTGTGRTASHTYAAAGTYAVKLTVTDNAGATGTVTKSVTVAAPANVAPTASFTSSASNLAVSVDGSASTDPDGTIASYAWDFGDGKTGTGRTASHTYAAAGTYAVKLTVTDNAGATGTVTKSVTVAAPANVAPTASFTSSASNLALSVDGSASADPDGTIASYGWDFGDGSTGTGRTASHTYAAAGTYAVKLTVTDNAGATGTMTSSVTVTTAPPANVAPTASFTSSASNLAVSVDGSGSTDPDGSVASWAWDFGDGSTGTGRTASHTYAAAGTYAVKLTVTDNAGATGTVTKSVTVAAPANVAPTASFTSSASNLALSVDGSASADPDGTIASYAWDFGDGSTGTGRTASHTYAAAGTYAVKLTVTDNAGATGTMTRSVTVTTAPSALATDAFGRTVTGGWGSADIGGAWTISGTTSNATVTSGSGRLTAAAGVTTAASLGISARDIAFQADVVLQKAPAGGASFVSLGTRMVGSSLYETILYYGTDGTVTLILAAIVDGNETDLTYATLPGTFAAGTSLTVRMETSGSGTTTLGAKAWRTGTTEPAAWQITATDSTPSLQTAGGVYLELYSSSKATVAQTLQVDNVWAGAAGTKP